MATIKEDYVSFETAKLLKEKGMDISCFNHYVQKNNNDGTSEAVTVCTLQMAMKWLRKVHNIEISITFGFPFINGKEQYKYFWSVVKICNNHLEYPLNNPNDTTYSEEIADSYEQAVEAAIKYCLENLI